MSRAAVDLVCPRCDGANPVEQPEPGRIVDCAHCDRSFVVAAPETRAPDALAPTDVSLATSALAGASLTAIFYLGVVTPLSGSSFAALFADRGWVPYAIVLMSAWSAVILGAKYVLLRRQARAFDLDLLPERLGHAIDPESALLHIRHLESMESGRGNFLVARLTRALQHFRARGSAEEVASQVGQQAQIDADAVDASYTLVRTFIWAIPILGFIGTVLGIGSSVSGFADAVSSAADLGVLKQSIGRVTSGLGVAFDTTLLALVMSILVMFPASWLQKAERGFLARIEGYTDHALIRRLAPAETTGAAEAARTLRELQAEFERLTKTVGELSTQLERVGRNE